VFVPEAFRDRFQLSEESLVEIDLYSDLLYEMTEGLQVRSELAPFFVDMNRERDGSDRGGLPRHLRNPAHEYYDVNDELMLKRPYGPREEEQVLGFYDLYHDLLGQLVERMKKERGYALLFDCHSMTSTGLGRVHDEGESRANFVVGTLRGRSADSAIIDAFVGALKTEITPSGLGLSVVKDAPYAGGFITRNHHDPDDAVHVIQIEVSMDTYMYEPFHGGTKRYALKKPRLRLVREAVRLAFRAACEAAERLYRAEQMA
jgi:N-formylglutamate amidohydrolase